MKPVTESFVPVLSGNINENLVLWCWRFSYWCCQSFQSCAVWHHV